MVDRIYPDHYLLVELTDKFFRGISMKELVELKNLLEKRRSVFTDTLTTNQTGYAVVLGAIDNVQTMIDAFPEDAMLYSWKQYMKDNNLY
jgi:hypothetical protein